jgi:hypothetical protein
MKKSSIMKKTVLLKSSRMRLTNIVKLNKNKFLSNQSQLRIIQTEKMRKRKQRLSTTKEMDTTTTRSRAAHPQESIKINH